MLCASSYLLVLSILWLLFWIGGSLYIKPLENAGSHEEKKRSIPQTLMDSCILQKNSTFAAEVIEKIMLSVGSRIEIYRSMDKNFFPFINNKPY